MTIYFYSTHGIKIPPTPIKSPTIWMRPCIRVNDMLWLVLTHVYPQSGVDINGGRDQSNGEVPRLPVKFTEGTITTLDVSCGF